MIAGSVNTKNSNNKSVINGCYNLHFKMNE